MAKLLAAMTLHVLLAGASAAVQAQHVEVGPALKALRANDCTALGEVVNAGVAGRKAPLLYVAGLMFEEGYCVDSDIARAGRYYRQAEAVAARTDGGWRAPLEIGLMFALGDGLPRSYARAAPFLSHAYELYFAERTRADWTSRLASPRQLVSAEDDEWQGYLAAIEWLTVMRLWGVDLRDRAEMDMTIEHCPLQRTIHVSFDRTQGHYRKTNEEFLRQAIRDAYAATLAAMPPPAVRVAAPCRKAQWQRRIPDR